MVGLINIGELVRNEEILYQNNLLGVAEVSKAQLEFLAIRVNIRNMVIYPNSDTYYAAIDDNFKAIEENLSIYRNTIINNQEQEYYDNTYSLYAQYKDSILAMITAAKSNKSETDILKMLEKYAVIGNNTDNAFKEMLNYKITLSSDQIYHDKTSARNAVIILIVVILLASVTALVLATYISKIISKPLMKFSAFARLLTVGDVNVDKVIDDEDKKLKFRLDEIGILADAFNKMIASTKEQSREIECIANGDLTTDVTVKSEEDLLGNSMSYLVSKLHDLVSSIVSAAEQISAGSSVVADSSIALSQGATEQASSIQELTASLQEIASHTVLNAQNAQDANNLANQVKKDAEIGYDQMNFMLNAMGGINEASHNINKVINVIDDIAFQTNILALNAAVEAARAGQYGKGFTVVAQEVRNLASKSAQAAKQTTEMIESTIAKVEVGTKVANDTAVALRKIVDEVTQTAYLIDKIASASTEQAASVEQVNQGVFQISQVVQNNAALSEESAAASEELSSQATQLEESVSVFKIRNNSSVKSLHANGHQINFIKNHVRK